MASITRRRFLRDAAAGATVVGVGGLQPLAHAQAVLPDPASSGIEHIVVVMS
jgi:hypothetical protein